VDTASPAPYHPGMPEQLVDYETRKPKRPLVADDIAYIAPMAVFLLLTAAGASGTFKAMTPYAYPIAYAVKVVVVVALLVLLWKHYTKIRWNHWWLGVIVGVVGIFQLVGMQLWLQRNFTFFAPSEGAFDPVNTF
jgi:membrane protein YdbS with pleckstrin-like domain